MNLNTLIDRSLITLVGAIIVLVLTALIFGGDALVILILAGVIAGIALEVLLLATVADATLETLKKQKNKEK